MEITHLSAYLTIRRIHGLFVLLPSSKSTSSFFSMNLVPAVLGCISLRDVGNTLVLFQDIFLIAISWNVCRVESFQKY